MYIVPLRSMAAMLLLGSPFAVVGCNASKNDYVPPPPPEVTVCHPVSQSITPFLEQNGVMEAVEVAEVRARVNGFVESIEFEPGQAVGKGDLLYRIEPDLYEAAANSAKAAIASAEASINVSQALVKTAEAELTRTKQNLDRQKALLDQNAGSQAEYDASVAAHDSAIAALESAKANVAAATAQKGIAEADLAQTQLNLDYTLVRAPISGRISTTDVKVGNLVENGTRLATVVNRDQVFVNFSISDREMLRLMDAKLSNLEAGEELPKQDWTQTPVVLSRENDSSFEFTGVLDYVDQQGVDVTTGTLALRAVFDNQEGRLFPGLFVTVRVPTQEPMEAMLLPEYAILRDQRGTYVLTVDTEQKIERTAVSVSRSMSGWAVIDGGLSTDSTVVIDGLQRARPGLPVTASEAELTVDDESLLRGLSMAAQAQESAQPQAADEAIPEQGADQQ